MLRRHLLAKKVTHTFRNCSISMWKKEFEEIDQNGDELVQFHEIWKYFQTPNNPSTAMNEHRMHLLKIIFDEADSNKDGKLSFEEFYQYMKDNRQNFP